MGMSHSSYCYIANLWTLMGMSHSSYCYIANLWTLMGMSHSSYCYIANLWTLMGMSHSSYCYIANLWTLMGMSHSSYCYIANLWTLMGMSHSSYCYIPYLWTLMGMSHSSYNVGRCWNCKKNNAVKVAQFHNSTFTENLIYRCSSSSNNNNNNNDNNNYDTNCNWCSWFSLQRIGTDTGGIGNKRTSGNHPNYSIIEIDQNTEKSPGDLRWWDKEKTK